MQTRQGRAPYESWLASFRTEIFLPEFNLDDMSHRAWGLSLKPPRNVDDNPHARRLAPGYSGGIATRRSVPSTASAASISARVMPRMNNTVSR